MKIGDKVEFLSETGGGRVAGFQGKNIVLVEDEDGFQIPTPITDVVVVEQDDYSMGKMIAEKMDKKEKADAHAQTELKDESKSVKALLSEGMEDDSYEKEDDIDPSDLNISFKAPAEERKGGNVLNAYLAFVPVDPKEITTTRFETYFVNDSNYYMYYTYMTAEGNSWNLKSMGEIEPNTKMYIDDFGKEDLNELGRVSIQVLAYKKDKSFVLKPTVDCHFRIDPVKFYKLHTFEENDFFEQPALLYTIVENDKEVNPLTIDARKLKEKMYQKDEAQPARKIDASARILGKVDLSKDKDYVRRYYKEEKSNNPFIIKRRGDEDVIVIDLHAESLLETTQGMSTADILHYQVDYFKSVMEENKKNKGQKIIFIHGKGEGVLRQSVIHELNYRYKSCQYQDASFQEYGYGATQVTIR